MPRHRSMSICTDSLGLQEKVLEHIKLLQVGASSETELAYFFHELGVPPYYFNHTSPEDIARHVLSLQAAKQLAKLSERPFEVSLNVEGEESAMFATTSGVTASAEKGKVVRIAPNHDLSPVVQLERHIEAIYLSGSQIVCDEDDKRAEVPRGSLSYAADETKAKTDVYRLQCFRSQGALSVDSSLHLRMYFLQKPSFPEPRATADETDIERIGDIHFLERTDPAVIAMFQDVLNKGNTTLGPAVTVEPEFGLEDGTVASLVLIAHRIGSTHSYFTSVAAVYRQYGMYAMRKHVEPFANNMVVFSFVLKPLDPTEGTATISQEEITARLACIARDLDVHYVLPRTSLTPLVSIAGLSVQEVAYAYSAWKFAFHFIERGLQEVGQLAALLTDNTEATNLLLRLKSNLTGQAYTEGTILAEISARPDLLQLLFADFATRHRPAGLSESDKRGHLCRINTLPPLSLEVGPATTQLKRLCGTERQFAIFQTFLAFNRNILKTNFYKPGKAALSFRLQADFLSPTAYPIKPYGVFFVVGAEFRGFHVRFNDVARGGIRIVRSRFMQDFVNNVAGIFDEAYNLASTQQRKNKDIPEGGSKGVILLNFAYQDKDRVAFEKYVDALMDLLLPHPAIDDKLGKPEILFLGPDEGTAHMMDWASLHAHKRGYGYWKAFTTGKSVILGGIPHDMFGMTTTSVRAYVEGIQHKLGLDPAVCTKMQTGGPDGDLGSNEIKQGKERLIGVVDGSGVLFDPNGLDHSEMLRLATARIMSNSADLTKFSDKAFFVSVDAKDITLPDGTVVASGLDFRNNFHFNGLAHGDFFVPCGGRPAAVNSDNVLAFLYGQGNDTTGAPRFRYVVEGANLFFTPQARLMLEKHGLIVFKDASANKGGVTSSSLEVLAALALTDDEFKQHMRVEDIAHPPAFYSAYVKQVQATIRTNAELEFECLWREAEATKRSRCTLSDELNIKITKLSGDIEASESLCNNQTLRNKALHSAIPAALIETIGFETVVSRLPESYRRALFASHLASRFIYKYGLNTPEFAFFEFVQSYLADA